MKERLHAAIRALVDRAITDSIPMEPNKGAPLTLQRAYNATAGGIAGLQALGDATLALLREVDGRLKRVEARLDAAAVGLSAAAPPAAPPKEPPHA